MTIIANDTNRKMRANYFHRRLPEMPSMQALFVWILLLAPFNPTIALGQPDPGDIDDTQLPNSFY
jgi:hypothetical protein